MQESNDGSYVVTFNHEGKSYIAAYTATTNTPPNTHSTATPNPFIIDLINQNINETFSF